MAQYPVVYQDWGSVDYKEAWDRQTVIQKELIAQKRGKRQHKEVLPHHFILCSHPPVYTLGKSGSMDHLLLSKEEQEREQVQFYKINRGGDITYHGPGQIVGYPILDLDDFFTDVHRYVRTIEEAIIRTLSDFGIQGTREEGYTGVWLPATQEFKKRKICAIGVHLSRWVSMHGFALNVNPTLTYFSHIIPCGIQDEDKTITSMQAELKTSINEEEVKCILSKHFQHLFGWEWVKE